MRFVLLALAASIGAMGCGIRPLTSAELYGVAGQSGTRGGEGGGGGRVDADAAMNDADGGPDGGGLDVAGGDARAADVGADTDANANADTGADANANADAGLADRPDSGCMSLCTADQFCDELTGLCASRSGAGMLSGQVVDGCSGAILSALVGIAGRHTCSYVGKGSYFFSGLPLGMLKLTAANDGYESYGITVNVLPGGVVQDIRLTRVGGCAAPAPVDTPCSCPTASCTSP